MCDSAKSDLPHDLALPRPWSQSPSERCKPYAQRVFFLSLARPLCGFDLADPTRPRPRGRGTIPTETVAILIFRKLDQPLHLFLTLIPPSPQLDLRREIEHQSMETARHYICIYHVNTWPGTGIKSSSASAM